MSISFLQSLELTKEIFQNKSLLVVYQNGQVDGSFVLQFLASEFSRISGTGECDAKMLLILNRQSSCHWSTIASKLGWSITVMKERGQMSIIDTLQLTYNFLTGKENNSSQPSPGILDNQTGIINLEFLLAKCSEEVTKLCGIEANTTTSSNSTNCKKTLFIILEDFSSLVDCAYESDKNALEFLRSLRILRRDLNICIGTLVYSDYDYSGKYFCNLISQSLATTSFHITPLKTGFSSEVNGVLTLSEHERVFSDECRSRRPSRGYHYKLLDRGVKFTPL